MCGHLSVQSLSSFAHLIQEAAQDADTVELLVRVAGFLDLCEVPDSVASVLNDTVEEGERPPGQLRIATHLVDNGQKCTEESHDAFRILASIKIFSLLLVTH